MNDIKNERETFEEAYWKIFGDEHIASWRPKIADDDEHRKLLVRKSVFLPNSISSDPVEDHIYYRHRVIDRAYVLYQAAKQNNQNSKWIRVCDCLPTFEDAGDDRNVYIFNSITKFMDEVLFTDVMYYITTRDIYFWHNKTKSKLPDPPK